jgi:radical SAM superfamily enzyme YgiQ (UPF0313 family)
MGAYLKHNGHQVKILEGDKYDEYGDLDFSDQESSYQNYLDKLKTFSDPFWKILKKEILGFQPDYIGVTFWTTFIASSIRTAQYCKMVWPSATIISGGPHVTLSFQDIESISEIDIGIIGEGEQTVLEIVDGKPLNSIDGIFYKKNGKIIHNPPRSFTNDLDRFGIPDRSLLLNLDQYDSEDMGLIMTSRGCPFNCAYCATTIWKNKIRHRSIPKIIEEIKSVKKCYGTIYFTIKDDSFTADKKYVYDFCHQLKKEKIRIFWECNANLSTIDANLLEEMESAGCIAMKVGIETGSDRIHKVINKRLNNDIVVKKRKLFNNVNIHLTCYFMIGIPSETKDDIFKTVAFAKRIKPDFISLSVYEIFPGTKLHNQGIKDKTAVPHMQCADFFKIQPHNYYFANQKRSLAGMTNEEFDLLEENVKTTVGRYNRLPRNIYRRIKLRYPIYRNDPKSILYDLKKFIKWV